MLKELLNLLHHIQTSQKGSIGQMNNVYLPQIDRQYVDTLERYLRFEVESERDDGASLIAAERIRQITEEGWTAEHDDLHEIGEMALAAICYASSHLHWFPIDIEKAWPWSWEWWKPKDDITNLVRAGALIAAEIDRLKRIQGRMPSAPTENKKENQ